MVVGTQLWADEKRYPVMHTSTRGKIFLIEMYMWVEKVAFKIKKIEQNHSSAGNLPRSIVLGFDFEGVIVLIKRLHYRDSKKESRKATKNTVESSLCVFAGITWLFWSDRPTYKGFHRRVLGKPQFGV